MNRILLCTDGSIFSHSSYMYGIWLATRLNAKVNILHVSDTRNQLIAGGSHLSGSIGIDASDILLQQLVALEYKKAKLNHQKGNLILQDAESILTDGGVLALETMHKVGVLVDFLPELESDVDLIILGKRGETADFASGHLGANLERILRSSHKPCLVTSRQFNPITKVLLAYDSSKSCEQILLFLIDSPAFKGLDLHIINVTKSPEDVKTSLQLKQAEEKTLTVGFKPVCLSIQGNPETVIDKYIKENNINLLLMGAYGHSRIRHLVIGSTTTQILRSSDIPVLVFR